jgi:hypothetical protein
MIRIAPVLILTLGLATAAAGQANIDGSAGDSVPRNRVADALESGGVGANTDPALLSFLDDAGRAALTASLTAEFQYEKTAFEHRRKVFDWQLLSSQIIFFVVIGLVLAGLYFSWLQFVADRRQPAARDAAAKGSDGPPDDSPDGSGRPEGSGVLARAMSTLELSTDGIKVSSPVVGVIILVISLAFFYLYLVHIYPIIEVTGAV